MSSIIITVDVVYWKYSLLHLLQSNFIFRIFHASQFDTPNTFYSNFRFANHRFPNRPLRECFVPQALVVCTLVHLGILPVDDTYRCKRKTRSAHEHFIYPFIQIILKTRHNGAKKRSRCILTFLCNDKFPVRFSFNLERFPRIHPPDGF